MRLLILVPLFLLACSAGSNDAASESLIQVVGKLEHKKLNEASGLARSNRQSGVFWAMNDDGPARIYALDETGRHLGRVDIEGAKNRDWEDLASFVVDGTPYLAIGDIGDNEARYKHLTVYIIEEPDPEDDAASIAWEVKFRYAGGPRDVESMAVDAENGHLYVLSKRTVPAELYQLPLRAHADDQAEDVLEAKQVAILDSLPQPNQDQLRNAMQNGWGWQPTGMDFAPDGRSALILTYDGVNYFSRAAGQTWVDAFEGRALHLALGNFKKAEAISYTDDSAAAMVTVEAQHAPLLRVRLEVD